MFRNKERNKTIVKIILSLFLAMWLYYFIFFRDNPELVLEHMFSIPNESYLYIFLTILFGWIAYVIRGFRWLGLIKAIGHETTIIKSVAAVSFGYFVNLVLPRGGEIARCTSIYKTDKIPVDKLLGTILIERVIDMIILIFLIIISLVLNYDIFLEIFDRTESSTRSPINPFGIVIVLIFAIIFVFWRRIKSLKLYSKLVGFLLGIKEGFVSIKNLDSKKTFWAQTALIWVMYFLMTFVCFFILPETTSLSLNDALLILVVGGLGMVVPVPGGVGSYHYLVMIALVSLGIGEYSITYAKEYNPALLFPFIIHLSQTFLAIISGIISTFILFLNKDNE
ncbi:MAG: hypothetical protein CMP51_01835 [Flavobacteriales bacterium]|nr:hypothetical protein [Flavobacteriales bacterium]|tara:strand:+ start:738 stop:1748 length:1011 start_codon:yes stop_codon:yes gene_type:complete